MPFKDLREFLNFLEKRIVKTMDEAKIIEEAKKRAEEVKERARREVEWNWKLI